MKKILLFFMFSKLIFALGGIEIGTSPSTSSISNPAQTANITPEAPFYNPSATMFLENGDYLYLGACGIFPEYETNINGSTFLKTTTFQPVPSFAYTHKTTNYSFYFASGTLGQGGFLKYNVSYDAINNFNLTVLYPGIVLGGAFKLNDKISVSLGGRIIYSRLQAEGKILDRDSFKSYIETVGVAPEISFFYTPTKDINLGLKYLAKTKLDYNGKVKQGVENIVTTVFGKYSVDHRKDFPAVLSLGGLYHFNNRQRLSLGYNWIFESDKTIDNELYHKYKDTHEYSIGFEQELSSKFTGILGYGYTDRGTNGHTTGDMTQLSSQQFGIGVKYNYSNSTIISVVGGMNLYKTDHGKILNSDVETKRKETILGIGLEMKL
ncbi:MAG: hypothetical protein RR682_09010 [Cetobacterium sp.]|uniref:OmpP1/FadL family transporter n=1 Tax=Cetobacterium sp. TaxID=2071632 RepID=UPI002FC8675B